MLAIPQIITGTFFRRIDVVAEDVMLPALETGDLVIGHEMGAYTAATRTRFNLVPDAAFINLEDLPEGTAI